jgi:hypothetical protein
MVTIVLSSILTGIVVYGLIGLPYELTIGQFAALTCARDKVVEAWSGELETMSYAENMKMLDLMLLVATLDNRSEIEEVRDTVQRLE